MLFSFVKKQLLLIIRRPQELIILLAMPLILIAILGFSLGSFLNGDATTIHANVAIVEHGNEDTEIEGFYTIIDEAEIPDQVKVSMREGAKSASPLTVLKQIFGSEQLDKYIDFQDFSPSELEELQKNDKYAVIIEVPENFTMSVLETIFFGAESELTLKIHKNENEKYSAQMVEDIIVNFQNQYNASRIAGSYGVIDLDSDSMAEAFTGSIETLTKADPISSFEYYTAGMSVMFILFIASYVSSLAFEEKKMHIFDRILLSNTSRWSYFTGIVLSGLVLAFLQQMIIYGLTVIIYGISIDDLLAFLLLNIAVSFAIGGLAALLTAISFSNNSENVSNFFNGIFVMILSFLGGSFTPSNAFPDIIATLGNLTPNGNAMNSVMKLMQGSSLSDILSSVVYLFIFGLVLTVIGATLFPKRGKAV